MDILSFIEETNRATNPEELFSILEKAMASYGFDRVLFSLMTDHINLNKSAGHGLMRNYPDDWMAHYTDKNYQDIDPVRQYVFQAPTAFLWEDMERHIKFSKEQKKCMAEAKEAGLNNGIAFPMRGPVGSLAGIGAASSVKKSEISSDELALLNVACQQFYVAYTNLESKKNAANSHSNIRLTNRETEVLKWCAQGKTTWEISVILGLSEDGVLFHLKNVMKKFSTSSRVYAVMQAIRMGLICI